MGAAASVESCADPNQPLSRAACSAVAGDRVDERRFNELAVGDGEAAVLPGGVTRLLQIEEEDGAWIDPDFDRARAIIGHNASSGAARAVHWRGVGAQTPVVAPDVAYSDAKQGHEGDCFLVACMALLATRPQLLGDAVRRESSHFVVRMHKLGGVREVVVDGLLPWMTSRGTPLYTQCRRRAQACFGVIEKAVVKANGGWYHGLSGGNTAEALYELTGCAVEEIDLEKERAGAKDLASMVRAQLANGDLIACGACAPESRRGSPRNGGAGSATRLKSGLRSGHAYAVVGETGDRKCALVYNPMGFDDDVPAALKPDGSGTYRVPWPVFAASFNRVQMCATASNTRLPHVLTFSSMDGLGSSEGRDTTWSRWLTWTGSEDEPNAAAASASRITATSIDVRGGGCTNFISFRNNAMFLLPPSVVHTLCAGGGEVEVILGQGDRRPKRSLELLAEAEAHAEVDVPGSEHQKLPSVGSMLAYPQLGITVISFEPGTLPPLATAENYTVETKTRAFLNRREVCLRFAIGAATGSSKPKPGKPSKHGMKAKHGATAGAAESSERWWAIVPSTFYPGQAAQCWMSIRTAAPIPLADVPESSATCVPRPPANAASWRALSDMPCATWEGTAQPDTWLRLNMVDVLTPPCAVYVFVSQDYSSKERALPIGAWIMLVPAATTNTTAAAAKAGAGATTAPSGIKVLAAPTAGPQWQHKTLCKAREISLRVALPAGSLLSDLVVVPVAHQAPQAGAKLATVVAVEGSGGSLQLAATRGQPPSTLIKPEGNMSKKRLKMKGGGGKVKRRESPAPGPSLAAAKKKIDALGGLYAGLDAR